MVAGAGIGRSMARTLLRQLDQRATVYTRGTGGAFDVTDTTDLHCLLQDVGAGSAPTAPARAELTQLAILYWDPAYTMPEHAQIVVDSRPGERYQVQSGTATPDVGPGNVTVMMHADCTRAKS